MYSLHIGNDKENGTTFILMAIYSQAVGHIWEED